MSPPFLFMTGTAWLVIGLVWRATWQARSAVRLTTLISAWNWTVLALALWSLSALMGLGTGWLTREQADHVWHATAVLAVCPGIAVLGSRRPGTRVWTWFIQVPLVLALGWPVLALGLQSRTMHRLELETPQIAAYCLVLVMSVGNYFGTRFTLASLVFGTACLLLVTTSSALCPVWLSDRTIVRWGATLLLGLAVSLARRSNPIHSEAMPRVERLWLDFFDLFGVVWGRRIQERVNGIADREKWPVRLGLLGLETPSQTRDSRQLPIGDTAQSPQLAPASPHEMEQLEKTLRWLLRRFVEPEWINQRLNSPPTEVSPPAE